MQSHRRPRSAIRSLVAFAALLVALVALAGCGNKSSSSTSPAATTITMLDTHKVALAIKASILSQRNVRAHVVCPPSIIQAKGRNFVCTATTNKGTTQFVVIQDDNAGHVKYAAGK